MSTPVAASFLWAGHGKRWAALARAFDKDIIPQSLLISGPPQIGKWTMARRYAQLLLCSGPVHDENDLPAPCGECRVCHQVEIETAPDFSVFRPLVGSAKDEKDWVIAPAELEGSILTIDVARKINREALKKPLVGARKVFIVQQAGRMNPEAQNALLKTFEEPAQGLTIILLADNPSGLLPTVRSRCWHLPLSLASDEEISQWLQSQFPDVAPQLFAQAVTIGAGRPGRAWREMQRLAGNAAQSTQDDAVSPRGAQTMRIVERILHSQPFGALGLTEEALKLAQEWWESDLVAEPDQKSETGKTKGKSDAKVARSAAARFLDELALAYRICWANALCGGADDSKNNSQGTSFANSAAMPWAAGLDLIRKTRHYILRNANTGLALDVMFGRLIALHRAAMTMKIPLGNSVLHSASGTDYVPAASRQRSANRVK